MVSSHAALLVLRVSSALALLMRLVGSSTAALLPVHRSRRWESPVHALYRVQQGLTLIPRDLSF